MALRGKGRRSLRERTIAKTYMFLEEDIAYLLKNYKTPKEIFHLGVLACKGNPQLLNRVGDVEVSNETIQKALDFYKRKYYELRNEVEKLKK